MGSIHERLQILHQSVKAEQQQKADLEAQKRKKLQEEEVEGKRKQYPKLMILKERGILSMLADATNGREMEPEWPLSYEERLEQGRQRTAEWLEKVKNIKPQEKPLSDLHSSTHVDIKDLEDYWQVEVMPPGVTDELEWHEKVEIVATKKEKRTRNWQTVHEEVAKVIIGFDGVNLTIAGQDISFAGPIPENEDDKNRVLEEAFVKAFFYPEDIRVKPAVPPHRHGPELYAG